jgi:hypothetical protein
MSIPHVRSSLDATPSLLSAWLPRLPDALLHVNEGDGTWSPLQVLMHLAWGEVDDWMPRIRRLLDRGTSQSFTPFDREAGFQRYAGWTLDALLAEFARLRAGNLDDLDRLSLAAADLSKQGRHPEFGPVTLGELLATWATHDVAHITQIARVLTRHFGADAGPWKAYFSVLQPRHV